MMVMVMMVVISDPGDNSGAGNNDDARDCDETLEACHPVSS